MASFVKYNFKIIVYALIVFAMTTQSISLGQITELSIDINEEYQTIDNFGASDCWSFQIVGGWETSIKEEIADLLFSTEKGIGLSAWRFNIGGGKENNRIQHPWRSVETFEFSEGVYDWNRQANETWFLHAAKERGVEQFIAFVNSPPARMTKSGFTNCDDGLGSTNLKDNYENQYATYLVDILKHFRDDENVEFSYISPVNEPQWEWNESNQEGNRASNNDIKNIVTALQEELVQQNISTQITIGESGTIPNWFNRADYISNKYGEDFGNYLSAFCNDTILNKKISKVLNGHSYQSDLIDAELLNDRIALRSHLLNFLDNGWKYWQTEYCQMEGPNGEGGNGRDLKMSTALNIARIIHFDLTVLNASAWHWWTAISPEDYKDGLLYTDYLMNGTKNIIESKILWTLGNFSKFIRPGSKRIKCTGATDKYSLMASAYKDEVNGKLIIVIVNISDVRTNISFSISGVENSLTFTSYITSDDDDDDLKEYVTFDSDNEFIIPERSVITLVADLDGNELPIDSPKLYNNYPNPFNSDTNISFSLPSESKISLEVYDTLGRRVKTLINDIKSEGPHSLKFQPKDLSSGLYLARLSSYDYSDTIKMIYLK
jgi:O-glycosyl hydrolase